MLGEITAILVTPMLCSWRHSKTWSENIPFVKLTDKKITREAHSHAAVASIVRTSPESQPARRSSMVS
ncbi:hypothetical protein UY3_08062 [Chelonia mydas]|uniref:Uncharacterized protein n=1 Tax=Chelonia mydas TaxID=8469 RepID=M7B9Y1_CHEMY|nr:hypothetical protein UY3_08062 [Chelonia mydas]